LWSNMWSRKFYHKLGELSRGDKGGTSRKCGAACDLFGLAPDLGFQLPNQARYRSSCTQITLTVYTIPTEKARGNLAVLRKSCPGGGAAWGQVRSITRSKAGSFDAVNWWDTTIRVLPGMDSSRSSIRRAVASSRFASGSSRISTSVSRSNARARHTRLRSPPERFAPPSAIGSSRESQSRARPTSVRTSHSRSSGTGRYMVRLLRRVSAKSVASWRTTVKMP